MKPVVLASSSAIRASILSNAGVAFEIERPATDEAALKRRLSDLTPEELALALAQAKALSVTRPGALIIGCDQLLEFDGARFDKPDSMAEAAARLAMMQGRAHRLINGLAVVQDGETLCQRASAATLHMRPLTHAQIEDYLEQAGGGVLSSVGAYQVEGIGARLFERIEGDYFSVLGLPLFSLLAVLREQGALAW